jgi:uncharacterized protein
MSNLQRARNAVLLLAFLVEGGLVVLALVLGWLLGLSPAKDIRWDWFDAGRGAALTLPLLFVGFLLLRWPFGPFLRIKQFTHEILCPMLAPCTRTDLFGISLLAGFGEEMLFRGVVQVVLTQWLHSPVWGLALASILFGLLHAVTFTYAVVACLMGVYLGCSWLFTKNLLVPIVTHTLYDFVLLWYLLHGPGMPANLRQKVEEWTDDAEEEKEPFRE